MKINIITLFPDIFTPLQSSIMKRASVSGHLELNLVNLRDFAVNKYGQVDDEPYGGESGMVIMAQPLADAICSLNLPEDSPIVFMTPQGRPLNQAICQHYADAPKAEGIDSITIICGHYKGIDERIRDRFITDEISIGDFVLTGGELPAMVFVDSIIRLLPHVLGSEDSGKTDSFSDSPLLGWPVYTRPSQFMDMKVPEVLLSGHHANIQKWKVEQRKKRTQARRPDLWSKYLSNN